MIDLSTIREATPGEMPVIDLSRFDEENAADLRHLGDVIVGALRTSGFFVLVGHGVRRVTSSAVASRRRESCTLSRPSESANSRWGRASSVTWGQVTTR